MERILGFYKSHKYVDCFFKLDGQQIGAHKLILAGSSPTFESMLFGNLAQNVIELCDVKVGEFKQVLEYIYTGNINIYSVINAWNLYYIANKYLLDALKFICIGYIKNHLTINNLVMSYEYSDLYDLVDLKKICLDDIINYFNGVFNCYYHMKPSTVHQILKKLKVHNINLLVNVVNWGIIECEIKKLTILPSNIIGILTEENMFSYFKRNCLDFTNCAKIKDNVTKDTLMILIDVFEWTQDSFDPTMLFQTTITPNFCHLRTGIKIASSLGLLQHEEFISEFIVAANMMIFGLSIGTPIAPYLNYSLPHFDGEICVRICYSDSERDVIEPVKYVGQIPYGETSFYINLNNVAVLESECSYNFRISFYNPNDKEQLPLHCYYMSENLLSTSKEVAITFYEMNGSIIRGVSFYPA
ncbi:BTB/POZ domain-containing protein 3 [Diabrotica undecimpunctata]|uniref:BTB/POZ domain-containing protein 3 n=1 Tax=Diabrotica undecimpunctata TaxID=50387 RepID=UPI003B63D0D9